jgi:crotonobetaine/carnitine-CoA ligase
MYSGMNDIERWVLPLVLAEQASVRPDATWIIPTDGEAWSFGQADADVRQVAGFFAGLGVRAGDRVVVVLPNGCNFVRAWLGLLSIGAVAVLLNTELRGAFLRHQLQNSGVELAVIDTSMLACLFEVIGEVPALQRVVVTGETSRETTPPVELIDFAQWKTSSPYDGPSPRAQDIASVMYTSGTSGPSKGVLMPHAHCTLYGIGTIEAVQLSAHDRYYITLPLFHSNGLLMQLGATLLAGIAAIVRPRFSASAWLDDVRSHRATVSNLLGATATFVLNQPQTPGDSQHHLRALLNAPNLPAAEQTFRNRFGVRDVISGFGMTETNIPVWGRIGRSAPGAAGWVHTKHFEVIIADPATDMPRAAGELGEILVRPKVPFGFMQGYHLMPEGTVESWRNLWFHTGDAGVMDADGLITFVDRIKDCIRRRGENIAASEVEGLLAQLPGIAEIAAFAVDSDIPGGEDELMLAIVPSPRTRLVLAELGQEMDRLLPRFARPRFIEVVEALPKTATGKVQRAVLRNRGSSMALDRGAVRERSPT